MMQMEWSPMCARVRKKNAVLTVQPVFRTYIRSSAAICTSPVSLVRNVELVKDETTVLSKHTCVIWGVTQVVFQPRH